MNFSSSQPSTTQKSFHHNGNFSSNDDHLNSMMMSLADLSVGSGGHGSSGQLQNNINSVSQGINQAPSNSSSHGSNQFSDLIAGGDSFNWGTSPSHTGAIRQQSASSVHSQSQYIGSSDQRKRGESIDVFLSRSPSQSLGTEFLKFRNEDSTRSIPSLSLDMSNSNRSNSIGLVGNQQHNTFQENALSAPIANHSRQSSYSHGGELSGNSKHGRDISPSCSVTGTSASSRSVSPTWYHLNDGARRGSIAGAVGHTIHQYDQANNFNTQTASFTSTMSSRRQYSQGSSSSHDSFTSGHLYNGNTSNYDKFQMQNGNHESFQAQNTSYDNFQGQSAGMNTSFGLSVGGLDSMQDSYHGGRNNSNQNFRSATSRDEFHFNRQQMMPHSYDNGMNDSSSLKQSSQGQPVMKEAKPQQQVFYMAVPTEDGQGQVLQPIQMQMVQIPGQPNAFVLPTSPHPTNIVSAASLSQSNPVSLASGMGFHNPQIHTERKAYNFQNPRHQLDNQYGYTEDGFDDGYVDETSTYGDKQFHAARLPVERRESVSNGATDIVATLYASPQRPPLRELLGHVRRLSRDQVGCRLLQQALDEEGASAASMILKEGLSFWGEAMVDPFGNYLFQKILEKVTAEERIVLVQNVSPRLVNASLNLHGTRSVQKVVELCAIDEKENSAATDGDENQETASEILTRSLTPAAARLCIDSHGNHVIQRILLKLPYKYSHFVFDAVANSVGDVARHRHGCCVIQRCLDSPPSAARSNLVHRIVEKSLELMQDAYGNYVVQYVLDVCSDEDVHAVCESVVGKVTLLAIQKFSSNVMEKCLERCTDKVREMYLSELSDFERIRELMMDPFGNYVIQRALAVSTHSQAVQLVEAMKPHLFSTGGGIKNTAGGRRILAKISKRFPNFSIGDEFGESENIQKHGHKKTIGNRHDNNTSMDQTSARFNRRGQDKNEDHDK